MGVADPRQEQDRRQRYSAQGVEQAIDVPGQASLDRIHAGELDETAQTRFKPGFYWRFCGPGSTPHQRVYRRVSAIGLAATGLGAAAGTRGSCYSGCLTTGRRAAIASSRE